MSTTQELGDSELPTGGSASLFNVKHCGIQFPRDLCVARPQTRTPSSTTYILGTLCRLCISVCSSLDFLQTPSFHFFIFFVFLF